MRWTVIYRPDAADELATIWLNAQDRQAVANAANQIDRQLANDPLSSGESREENTRIICEGPLTVLFDVVADDRTVTVWGIFCHE